MIIFATIYGSKRIKSVLKNNGTPEKTVIFAGNFERITENGATKDMYYIGDAIYVKEAGQSDKILYAHKDHLGSIISITDDQGVPVFRATYDAWGKQTLNPANTFNFHRGYTGHEHLPEFELINMNARLYDPMLGRVLSPDPYVQNPFYTQDYNRYSYVLNNPMKYTDRTGMVREPEDPTIYHISEVTITPKRRGGGFPIFYIYEPTNWGFSGDIYYTNEGGGGYSGGGGGTPLGSLVPQIGDQVLPPLAGTWPHIVNFISPRTYGPFSVNAQGKITGLTPITGMAPTPGKGIKTLQTGGHILNKSTLNALKLSKEQGKNAIEALKKDVGLPPNAHFKIMSDGSVVNPHNGFNLGSLFDYLY